MTNTTKVTWMPVIDGPHGGEQVIMCRCGDPSCYRALVVTDHGDMTLEIYEDYSDKAFGQILQFDLPDEYALCKRGEPEPITAETLERDGWTNPIKHWIPPKSDHLWDKPLVSVATAIDQANVEINTIGGVSITIPHCKTMQQLRQLVEMLGGTQ